MASVNNYAVARSWALSDPRDMSMDWSSYFEGVTRMSRIGPSLFSYQLCIASRPDWRTDPHAGPILVYAGQTTRTTQGHIHDLMTVLSEGTNGIPVFHVRSADHPNVREFQARTADDHTMRVRYPLPVEGTPQYLRNFHNTNIAFYEELIEDAIDRTKRARRQHTRQHWLERSATLGVERDMYRLWAIADIRRGR